MGGQIPVPIVPSSQNLFRPMELFSSRVGNLGLTADGFGTSSEQRVLHHEVDMARLEHSMRNLFDQELRP